jgi:hypothetical protein
MFKKSFAETLKENLREDSFKPPPPPPKPVIKYKESPTLFHEELYNRRRIKEYIWFKKFL